MNRGVVIVTTVCLVLIVCPAAAQTSTSCVSSQGYGKGTATTIGVRVGTGWTDPPPISAATAFWNNGCGDMAGTDFPDLLPDQNGQITIYVSKLPGPNPTLGAGCARFNPSVNSNNVVTGGTIEIYACTNAGADCIWVLPHATLDNLIAHELGHVLNLRNSDCDDYIMGDHWASASVQSAECNFVDGQWDEPYEDDDLPKKSSCGSCWTTCNADGSCPPPPVSSPPGYTSPIIVDVDDDRFELCGVDDAVLFDIDADGALDATSWTGRGSGDAFLALDRNENGIIDDGSELFGNVTPLRNGIAAPNGYEALAEFDQRVSGGNDDGVVDARDAVWPHLRLWIDENHDGRSQPEELQPAWAAIMSIETSYTLSNRIDAYGNIFRYKGMARVLDKHGRVHPHSHVRRLLSTAMSCVSPFS